MTPDLRLVRKACLDAATQSLDSSMRMKILIKGVMTAGTPSCLERYLIFPTGEDESGKLASATHSYFGIITEVQKHIETFVSKDNIRQTHTQTLLLLKIITEVRQNRAIKV